MSRTVTLRLQGETYERFRTLAERENRPLSNFIETAASRYIEGWRSERIVRTTLVMADPTSTYSDDGFYIHPKPLLDADLVSAATTGMDSVRDGLYDTGTAPFVNPSLETYAIISVALHRMLPISVSSQLISAILRSFLSAQPLDMWIGAEPCSSPPPISTGEIAGARCSTR